MGDRTVYLDADQHGIGDAVTTAWIAEGAKSGPVRLVHKATGIHRRLLEMLGQVVIDDMPPDGNVNTYHTYRADELRRERGSVPRPSSRARGIGITSEPMRPPVTIPEEAEAWAAEHAPEEPFVLLFPQSHYRCRVWPKPYWVELAWRLHVAGVPTRMMLGRDDERLHNVPSYYFGSDIAGVAALMRRAAVTVTNDSGPAHLGGTLGVPTLALIGPTNPAVFANYDPPFRTLRAENVPCVGCHWGIPYRASCDQGCHALSALGVVDVFDAVAGVLRPDLEQCERSGLWVRSSRAGERDRQHVRDTLIDDCYGLRGSESWRPDSFIVDVGARVGGFAAVARAAQPRAKVVSIESDSDAANVLKVNCGRLPAGTAYAQRDRIGYRETSGATTTIERVLREYQAVRIDLLKLDCGESVYDILLHSPAVNEGPVRRIVGRFPDRERFSLMVRERFSRGWESTVRDDRSFDLRRL